MKKRAFLINALCLTASAFVMRMINMGYRVYLTDKIGAEGMGLYQLIYSVFVFAITVSTAGISLSVTRIVTDALSTGKQQTVRNRVRKCIAFSLCMSVSATIGLIFAANWIGNVLLGDSRVILSLQVLAIGLPFMATCSCLKGYFLAVRGVIKTALGELLEQIVTISIPICLFVWLAPSSVEYCCCAIMVGSTAGEMASCFYTYLLYRLHLRKTIPGKQRKSHGTFGQICHIALPITFSSTLRSGLTVIENILIPIGFRKNGASAESALSEYGILSGMVMPILFFPATFLTSFASLLVPEMAEAFAMKQKRYISYVCGRAIRTTLLFSIFVAVFFFCFSGDLGILFYKSAESARLIQILAPLIPLWYLDFVVDSLLKGLDQQLHSMTYNFFDAAIRVVLVYFLIPIGGTKGYLCILFFSTIFNAALSIHRLLKISELRLYLISWVIAPTCCAGVSVLFSVLLVRHIPILNSSTVAMLAIGFLLSVTGYYILLRICGSVQKEDIQWTKGIFLKEESSSIPYSSLHQQNSH